MSRHRWGEKAAINPYKSETECQHGCGIIKVSRQEFEGGRAIYWTEFWRDGERIEGNNTPPCTGPAKAIEYKAGNHPL